MQPQLVPYCCFKRRDAVALLCFSRKRWAEHIKQRTRKRYKKFKENYKMDSKDENNDYNI